jgi:hypothetical protein
MLKIKFKVPNPARRALLPIGALLAMMAAPAIAGTNLAEAAAKDPHAEVLTREGFPSASQCGLCHKQIYKEWASSNHWYSSI